MMKFCHTIKIWVRKWGSFGMNFGMSVWRCSQLQFRWLTGNNVKTFFEPNIDKGNISKSSKKISQIQKFGATLMILSIKLNNFGSIWLWNNLFGLKCHIPLLQIPVSPHLICFPRSAQIKKLILQKLTGAPKISHFGDRWWPQPCIKFTQTQYSSPPDPNSFPLYCVFSPLKLILQE